MDIEVIACPHDKLSQWFTAHSIAVVIHDIDATKTSVGPLTDMLESFPLIFDDEDVKTERSLQPIDAWKCATWLENSISDAERKGQTNLRIVFSCKGGSCRSVALAMLFDAFIHGAEHAAERFARVPDVLPNRLVFNTAMNRFYSVFALRGQRFENADVGDTAFWDEAFAANRRLWDAAHLD